MEDVIVVAQRGKDTADVNADLRALLKAIRPDVKAHARGIAREHGVHSPHYHAVLQRLARLDAAIVDPARSSEERKGA